MAVVAYWGITFAWDFDAYDLVTNYVDCNPPRTEEFMMRELAVHAGDDYVENKAPLDRLQIVQSVALLAFGAEVLAVMYHVGLE